MLAAQLVAAVERLAPVALAEEWDNVGLIVGRHNQPCGRLLVALELRDEVLGEARGAGLRRRAHPPPADLPLAHAPDRRQRRRPAWCSTRPRARVAVVAAHTNLDAASGGLNALMAEMLGLSDARPLRPAGGDPGAGLGRVGAHRPDSRSRGWWRWSRGPSPGRPPLAGDPGGRRCETVACCTGSGGSLIPDAPRAAGADAYVTSDLKLPRRRPRPRPRR